MSIELSSLSALSPRSRPRIGYLWQGGPMYETEVDLGRLQELIDASFARSSEHLLSIMTPPRRITARRLTADLTGIAVLNVATVTARGEPRISALDGHFLHGRWYATTSGTSPKVRQLRARPGISAAEPGTSTWPGGSRRTGPAFGGPRCSGRRSARRPSSPRPVPASASWCSLPTCRLRAVPVSRRCAPCSVTTSRSVT